MRYFPRASLLAGLRCEIKVYFLSAANSLMAASSSTTPTWSIAKLKLRYEQVVLKDEARAELVKQAKNGIPLLWKSYQSDMTTWSSGTVHNMTLPGGFNNLKKTFVILRIDGDVGTTTDLDRHEHWVRDNLTSYQFMLQGQYFPQDSVDLSIALLRRDSWNR